MFETSKNTFEMSASESALEVGQKIDMHSSVFQCCYGNFTHILYIYIYLLSRAVSSRYPQYLWSWICPVLIIMDISYCNLIKRLACSFQLGSMYLIWTCIINSPSQRHAYFKLNERILIIYAVTLLEKLTSAVVYRLYLLALNDIVLIMSVW